MPLFVSWTPHNSVFVFPRTPKWNGHFHQPIGARRDTTHFHPWFQSLVMICNTVQNERNPAAAAEFVVAAATTAATAAQSSKNHDRVGKRGVNKNDVRPTKSKSKRSNTRKAKGSTHSSKTTKKDRIDSKKKHHPEQRDEAEERAGSNSSVDDERLATDGVQPVDSARTRSKKDHKLALSLQSEEDRKSKEEQRKREEKDRKLAQKLLEKEQRASQKLILHRERTDYTAMVATNVGKAVLAVERINELVDSMKAENRRFQFGLQPVGKETMVFFAEQLLAKQQEFKAQGIPFEVDVGYHYTDESSMDTIQTNGLMTREDRLKKDIQSRHRGAIFGDGIYTANNPISFQKYGRVGLIVARLQGKTVRVARSLR